MLPNDSVMLLSYVNLKLRDFYSNLEELCEDLGVEREELVRKLSAIDYHYNREQNQFK